MVGIVLHQNQVLFGQMLHCECGWAWEWDDNPTPYCPFCGKVGTAGPSAPQEAIDALAEATDE